MTCLLLIFQGVKAVIAESYERIHRSNLVGMGIIPLQYRPGQNAESLGLTGKESYSIDIPGNLKTGQTLEVKVRPLEYIHLFPTFIFRKSLHLFIEGDFVSLRCLLNMFSGLVNFVDGFFSYDPRFKITAGQRTMIGEKSLLAGHFFTLTVILNEHVFSSLPKVQQSCDAW